MNTGAQSPAGKEPLRIVASIRQVCAFLPEFFARLMVRRDSAAIDSAERLCGFVSTRAAFVAQKTLYGYLKTRMGTRYPSLFEDDVFVASINLAKMQVFSACLSDLAIYAVARALPSAAVEDSQRRELALFCFRRGLADNVGQVDSTQDFDAKEAEAAFQRRLAFHTWSAGGAAGAELFSASPAALYKWAPIAPELKQEDQEIVENSIKFAWRELRRSFEKRLDSAALIAEITGVPPAP